MFLKLRDFDMEFPSTPEEAVALHAAGGSRYLAGGTDLVLDLRVGKKPTPATVVNLKRLPGLDVIEHARDGTAIGALTRLATLERDPGISERFPCLHDAVRLMGSHQVRVAGTVGGNVCNASPAADLAPPFLVLDAEATFQDPEGCRTLPIAEVWEGPGVLSLSPSALLLRVDVPAPPSGLGSAYLRFTHRDAMDIAVAGVAAAIALDDGRVSQARLAIGAVTPVPVRVEAAERALVGGSVGPSEVAAAAAATRDASSPIDDVRASAEYRRHLVGVLTERAIELAATRARAR
ncbi:MAG: FAD binding domain-containing protein [Acidimicrobiia bacterium]|nr:FAD binding domain-containing protein [Acidimicrobiia bacterium]